MSRIRDGAERTKRERIYIRCTDEDIRAFSSAAKRDGAEHLTQWLLRLARLASRTAVSTMRSINSSALVRGPT